MKIKKDKNMQQICSAVVCSTNLSRSWKRCVSNEEENWNLIKLDIDQQVKHCQNAQLAQGIENFKAENSKLLEFYALNC